jgi:hypothetical protein
MPEQRSSRRAVVVSPPNAPCNQQIAPDCHTFKLKSLRKDTRARKAGLDDTLLRREDEDGRVALDRPNESER